MRNLVLVSTSVVLFSVGTAMLFGCSGTGEQAAAGEEEEKGADENLSGNGKKSASPAATSTSSTEPAPAADTADGGATWGDPDAAAPIVDPSAPQADLSMCKAGSVAETESNDSAAAANAMPGQTFSFCGSLASATDVDFVTFTLPADTRSFSYGVSFNRNGIDATITAGAQGTFRLNQAVPILPGQKYVVRIAGAQALGYRFDVNIGK
jgi:hypothetical protein